MINQFSSAQELIEKALLENKKLSFNHKSGYRTSSISGKDLHKKINSLMAMLKIKGVKKGDKIIILGYSSIEWITVYFACILSNITVVPLDVLTDKKLLEKIIKQVNAKAIFQSTRIDIPKIGKTKLFYLEELYETLTENADELPIEKAMPTDYLEIQYTSGTTGNPKGVILTHNNVFSAIKSSLDALRLRIHLRFLNILPLSHVFAQIMGLFLPLYYGYEVYFIDTAQPKKLITFIRNKRINAAIFVPGVLAALKKDLMDKCVLCSLGIQFRMIGVGGASLDIELERWWKRKLIFVLNGYGMTETSSVIAINSPFANKKGSVGRIAKGVEIKFSQDNEVLVKGENVTTGYYNEEEKTKNSFEDGWFKTGDVGELKNSFLYIKERKKDIIITSSGLKAYPIDIESCLNSIKSVKESCVIQRGNKIHAVLILNEKGSCEEIIKEANKKLLEHQKIASCSIWHEPQFPKTPTGKVKRFILEQSIDKEKIHSKFSYGNKVFETIHEVLNPNKMIKQKTKLVDLGMDSLKRIELISELEKNFDAEIDETRIDQNTSAADIEKIMNESRITRVKFRIWQTWNILGFMRKTLHFAVLFPIVRLFTKTEYNGMKNIFGIKEPVIFVSNHQSALDVPVIIRHLEMQFAVAASPEVVFGFGMSGMKKILRKMLGYYSSFSYNAYPFGTEIGTDTSLEFTGEMLDRNFSIILFPEGERTLDGKIHEFKPGIGFIVLNMQAPVVPIKLNGLFEVLPRSKIIPKFGKASVTFGKPIKFSGKQLARMTYQDVAKFLEQKVSEL